MNFFNRDLFVAELRRFRLLAVVMALVHVLVLIFLNRMADMQQQPHQVERVFMLVYMALAFLFALYQLGSYRRPSKWLWLLHRPLPHLTVYASISLASALLLALCTLLPRLLILLAVDSLTDRVVDSHHYLMPLHAFVLVLSAWLAGVCTVLSVRPTAAVVAIVPVWLMWSFADSTALLMVELLGLCWLLAITSTQFKPNRDARIQRTGLLVLSALPLQIGLYFVLLTAAVGYEFGLMFAGAHPLNMPVPPAGGFTEAINSEPRTLMTELLKHSRDPRANLWTEQLALMEPGYEHARLREYPLRHQAYQTRVLQWLDEKNNTEWTFSHDSMRFHGLDVRNGEPRGVWGVAGRDDPTPFADVPFAVDNQFLITPNRIYQIDIEQQRAIEQIRLPDAEVFIARPIVVGDQVIVISSHGLRMYAPDRAAYLQSGDGVRKLRAGHVIRVPGVEFMQSIYASYGSGSLARVDYAELVDGWLFSLTFGAYYTGDQIRQMMLHVDAEGQVQVVAERKLSSDFPLLYETANWWLSPAHYVLRNLPEALLDNGRKQPENIFAPRDSKQWTAAAVMIGLSLLMAWIWLRRTSLPASRKRLWLVLVMIGSLPAVLSLMLLERRSPAALRVPAGVQPA